MAAACLRLRLLGRFSCHSACVAERGDGACRCTRPIVVLYYLLWDVGVGVALCLCAKGAAASV